MGVEAGPMPAAAGVVESPVVDSGVNHFEGTNSPLFAPSPLEHISFPTVENLPPRSLESFRQQKRIDPVNQIYVDPEYPFGPKKEQFFREAVAATGMPLGRINTFAYRPNTYGLHGVLGSAELENGEMSVYGDMDKVDAPTEWGVIWHELAHFSDPRDTRATEDYGGIHNQNEAIRNVIAIANQSARTGIFLNDYHKYIYHLKDSIPPDHPQAVEAYQEWASRWFAETHAISIEMTTTHPEELAAVDQAQAEAMRTRGQANDFVPLVSYRDPQTNRLHISGPAQTIMWLTKADNLVDAKYHWDKMRHALRGQKTPFHETKSEHLFPVIPDRAIIIYGFIRRNPWDDHELLTPEEILQMLQQLPSSNPVEKLAA